jgi:hypothetical protein
VVDPRVSTIVSMAVLLAAGWAFLALLIRGPEKNRRGK